MTLQDVMPKELSSSEFVGTPAYNLRNEQVCRLFRRLDAATWKVWPGSQQNVHIWALLTNGKAVGLNENSKRGWSFPVVSARQLFLQQGQVQAQASEGRQAKETK